jgi:hypothetical protein
MRSQFTTHLNFCSVAIVRNYRDKFKSKTLNSLNNSFVKTAIHQFPMDVYA